MKKLIIIAISLLISIASCQKGNLFEKKVKIKGKVSANKSTINDKSTLPNLQDSKYVLFFYGSDYKIEEIKSDGSFSGKVSPGNATVLAFLTSNYTFIGNLFLKGLNFLPLGGIFDDIGTIDLSTLAQDSNRIIPQNDPIGNQIILNQIEQNLLVNVSSYYQSLAKNLDMNNNKKIDYMEHGPFRLFSTIEVGNCGKWGINSSQQPVQNHNDSLKFHYSITIIGPNEYLSSKNQNILNNAILSGPSNFPHNDITTPFNSYFREKEFQICFDRNSHLAFGFGTYNVSIDNKNLTFNYSSIEMKNFIVIPIPTLITNSSNEVIGVSLTFNLIDGTIVDPYKLIATNIGVSLGSNSNGQPLVGTKPIGGSGDPLDSNDDLDYVELPKPYIKIDKIDEVTVNYIDIFGNHYGIRWLKK